MMRTTVSDAGATTEASGLAELYLRFAPSALRFAFFLTGDREVARDLVQDAFVRVLGRFHDVRNRDAFWGYLRRTIVNLSNSYFRRRRVERTWLERQRPDPAAPPGPDVAERERVRAALMTLGPKPRAAVLLRYFEDLSEAETAELLGIPVGTVKSTVSRGLDRLREELHDA